MASPMTGYTRCPKCGLVVYVWQDSGTCYVCGKIKIERKGKSQQPTPKGRNLKKDNNTAKARSKDE